MNVRELAITLSKAAAGYGDNCEVISVSRFGVDGTCIKLIVDAGDDGDSHEQLLYLDKRKRDDD